MLPKGEHLVGPQADMECFARETIRGAIAILANVDVQAAKYMKNDIAQEDKASARSAIAEALLSNDDVSWPISVQVGSQLWDNLSDLITSAKTPPYDSSNYALCNARYALVRLPTFRDATAVCSSDGLVVHEQMPLVHLRRGTKYVDLELDDRSFISNFVMLQTAVQWKQSTLKKHDGIKAGSAEIGLVRQRDAALSVRYGLVDEVVDAEHILDEKECQSDSGSSDTVTAVFTPPSRSASPSTVSAESVRQNLTGLSFTY
ncbi:hypothetical protein N0V90_008814 [Kalmusia sp. IMI 367209]|nr:hypothetical protein N0V90_008814 [Kalmusia sp. IMI 367209]